MPTLRRQYDKLRLQASRQSNGRASPSLPVAATDRRLAEGQAIKEQLRAEREGQTPIANVIPGSVEK